MEQTVKSIKLKPCPFCGKNAAGINTKENNDGYVSYKTKYVDCKCCGIRTEEYICDGYYGMYCTDEEIADIWNRRSNVTLHNNMLNSIGAAIDALEKVKNSMEEFIKFHERIYKED